MARAEKGFAGYKMIVCAILICAGGVGFSYYSLNLYLPSWMAEFGISNGEGSIAFSIVGVTTMLGSFASSVVVGRLGLKRLYVAGAAALIAGYAIFLIAPNLIALYAGGVLLGLGISWAGMIPLGTIAPNWFIEKQGTMMGVVAASMGVCGVIANLLFANVITAAGWRVAIVVTICIVAVCCIPAAIVCKPTPEEIGQKPLGADALPAEEGNAVDAQAEYRAARKTPSFWLLCALVLCISSLICGLVPQVASVVTSNGFDLVFAGTISSIMQAANVVGAFAMGFVNDRFKLRGALIYSLIIGIVSMTMIFFCASEIGCVAFAVTFGLAQALLTTLYPLLIGPVFGQGASEQIIGFFNGVSGLGETIMPTIVGFSVTLAGTYNVAAAINIALIILGVTCGFIALKKAPRGKAQG